MINNKNKTDTINRTLAHEIPYQLIGILISRLIIIINHNQISKMIAIILK